MIASGRRRAGGGTMPDVWRVALDSRGSVGPLDVLGHRSGEALLVLVGACASSRALANGLDDPFTARLGVRSAWLRTPVPPGVSALSASVCVAVLLEVALINTHPAEGRGGIGGGYWVCRFSSVLKSNT